MGDYEKEDELINLSSEEKLKIIKIEIDKIISISNLFFHALKYNEDVDGVDGYLMALHLIDKSVWDIRKMFP